MKALARLLPALLLAVSNAAMAAAVAIVIGESEHVHREVAEVIQRGIADSVGSDVAIVGESEFPRQRANLRLVIAVGARAFETALAAEPAAPIVATLIPRQTYDALLRPQGKLKTTALFLDQPLERQFDLLRLALPDRRRLGVMLGPNSATSEVGLRRIAERRNLQLNTVYVKESAELRNALQALLPKIDVLLAVPDASVGSASLRNVLRAAFNEGVPLVAYSPSYVKAGALLALYSTPLQLGRQTAEIGRAVLGGTLPAPKYPRDYTVEANHYMARSLGLNIADESALLDALRKQELAP